jgi:hypothetical protein
LNDPGDRSTAQNAFRAGEERRDPGRGDGLLRARASDPAVDTGNQRVVLKARLIQRVVLKARLNQRVVLKARLNQRVVLKARFIQRVVLKARLRRDAAI